MFGPTPYATRISMHRSLSMASYTFLRSKKSQYSGVCLRYASCCANLALNDAVPHPLFATKPRRQSWNLMELDHCQSGVHDHFDDFPEGFEQTNTSVVPSSLRYQ